MNHIITLIICIIAFHNTMGQVATIKDSDGWTNVRQASNGQSDIIHKLYDNDVFWYDYETTDIQEWISIYIPKNDFSLGKSLPSYIVGFIHKSRLLPLDSLEEYSGENFCFNYEVSDFDSTNRIIDKQSGLWVSSIDGSSIWGTDGGFPRKEVKSIDVKINGKIIEIHKVFFGDIYECDNSFSTYKNGDCYLMHQWNSDAAGAYEIVWVFDKNGLKQRLVGRMN